MEAISLNHDDLYKEIRSYLVKLFGTQSVVKSIQNGVPLPENAIVMNIINESDLDMAVTRYDKPEGVAGVQVSVSVLMQIDFYGNEAGKRARILANLWRSNHATNALKDCQPLYAKDPIRAPVINEKSMYEDRFIVELQLQYNPVVTHKQVFIDGVDIQLTNL